MILVDTSVIIDYLRGIDNDKTKLFGAVLSNKYPYGISSYTFQEVLQGAKSDSDYSTLLRYLSSLTIYYLPECLETYEEAARMYFSLRRRGVTVRSTIDVLIALTAIKNKLFLLHNDKDFDAIETCCEGLKLLNA